MSAEEQAAADVAAILVAAGRGERAGSDIPKQFLVLEGRPMFIHALGVLATSPAIVHTAVVVPDGWEKRVEDMLAVEKFDPQTVMVVAGGARRQDSVWQGLRTWSTAALVLVHDAARPCLSADLVDRTIAAARQSGAATAALPITDTVMRASATSRALEIVDRSGLWVVQTPQVFAVSMLLAGHAHARAQGIDASDDGTLALGLGRELTFVRGDWWNIKVTQTEDLERAQWILRSGIVGTRLPTRNAAAEARRAAEGQRARPPRGRKVRKQ
ncbi:MAG TPA: 2-C-methyl-D-erythritol 4-phosphate cytidylyltransferase [Candidatus Krumholzibacteria bacterium]|nr:2-C-methyl-D-erythritol 4-phosphate cytidylyltransferase [Candidatus Krumholzibacteria bacterium]